MQGVCSLLYDLLGPDSSKEARWSSRWLEVIIFLLREPLLEKCCVSASLLLTHCQKKSSLSLGGQGHHCCCWSELRPRDLPDSSREEKESVQGAGPGGRPCTGAALRRHLPVATEVSADASIHQPNIEFLLSVSSLRLPLCFRLKVRRVFCGIWSAMLEDNSKDPLTLFKGREMSHVGWGLRAGFTIQGGITSCSLVPRLLTLASAHPPPKWSQDHQEASCKLMFWFYWSYRDKVSTEL